MGVRVSIDDRGRLPIPSDIRRQLGISEGDSMVIEPIGPGEFRAIRLKDAAKKSSGLYRELRRADESVADELIRDRRREASKEAEGEERRG